MQENESRVLSDEIIISTTNKTKVETLGVILRALGEELQDWEVECKDGFIRLAVYKK